MNSNDPPFKSRADIAGMNVTIMGLGLNGGGLASARFFAALGASVTVTDKKSAGELKPSLEALAEFPTIRYTLGTHDIADFRSADIVIKNPGIRLEGNEYLAAARRIESDISVFLRLTAAPILAVTGSKGKSSTVSALQFGLRELGYRSFLGGNITVSPLTFLDETDETTPVVLELSSWQLADLKGRKLLKPRVAIITPIMADHQNWYGGMEPYVADKKLIYADQDAGCHLLCNHDDGWGAIFASEARARGIAGTVVHWYGSKPFIEGEADEDGAWIDSDGRGYMRSSKIPGSAERPVEILPTKITVPGAHMRQNILNAAQVLVLFGATPELVGPALARFPGIEHRLEFFYEEGGARWYNDSAATVPEAVAAALGSFESPVILLAGGTDKGLEFTPLADALADEKTAPKEILLLAGSGTDKLIPLLVSRGVAYLGPFENLDELITAARKSALPGDTIVFSPGATSFGMFLNEFDRGKRFKETVRANAR